MKLMLYKNLIGDYKYCLYKYPFRIFYNLNGDERTPKRLNFTSDEHTPTYIFNILKSFYEAFVIYTEQYSLKSPLEDGIFFKKGAKFIDILTRDIPTQKGLVSTTLIDNSDYFSDTNLKGKSIRILLDRNLIEKTATPVHELFHVFQYNYCSFNNMWFMEGLARWSQNLTHKRKNIEENLPQTVEELEFLMTKLHDAEYFWRRLIKLVGSEKEFIKQLLEQTYEESLKIEEKNLDNNSYNKDNWTKEEKKNYFNNKYIFLAMLNVINKLKKNDNDELIGFLTLIEDFTKLNSEKFDTPVLQRFCRVLQKCDKSLVIEMDSMLYCEKFDVITKTLQVDSLDCSTLNEDELDSLNQIRYLDGNLVIGSQNIQFLNGFNYLRSVKKLIIKEMENLEQINGFNGLERLNSLEISSNQKLISINGFNTLFKQKNDISGFIKCMKNSNLTNVDFLKGVKNVGSSLYLYQNNLSSLYGLSDLESVDASITLSSNSLISLEELSNLKIINGILNVTDNNLKSLNGLENLTKLETIKWNGEDRTLSIDNNRYLEDISAIGNIKVEDNFIFYIDEDSRYKIKPDINSEFYKNSLEIHNYKTKEIVELDEFRKDNYILRPHILFGDKWKVANKKSTWMIPHHIYFSHKEDIVNYCEENNIEILFANNYRTQRVILENSEYLKKNGLKFIVNNKEALNNFVDKELFYDVMVKNGFKEYVPEYYTNKDDVKFPAMVKIKSGGAGKGMFIAYNQDDLAELKEDMIISEYLPTDTEYGLSIFMKDGKIIEHFTYSKKSKNDVYILQHENQDDIEVKRCEIPFLELFEKIVVALSGKDGYCQCSINFKINDGIPKIFEINPRIGYTLAGFPDDFKKLMDRYIEEINLNTKDSNE